MRNKDIFTIDRHLFIKKTPLRMSAWAYLRTHIRMDQVLDTLSVFGLVLLVGLLLVLWKPHENPIEFSNC